MCLATKRAPVATRRPCPVKVGAATLHYHESHNKQEGTYTDPVLFKNDGGKESAPVTHLVDRQEKTDDEHLPHRGGRATTRHNNVTSDVGTVHTNATTTGEMEQIQARLPSSNDVHQEHIIGSSTGLGKKKSVSFKRTVHVHRHICLNDFSDKERQNVWYSIDDLAMVRAECIHTIKMMTSGKTFEEDFLYSSRGLEYRTPVGAQLRRMHKVDAWDAVEAEQQRQDKREIFDADSIARVYLSCTKPCRTEAHELAIKDEQYAQHEYYSTILAAAALATKQDSSTQHAPNNQRSWAMTEPKTNPDAAMISIDITSENPHEREGKTLYQQQKDDIIGRYTFFPPPALQGREKVPKLSRGRKGQTKSTSQGEMLWGTKVAVIWIFQLSFLMFQFPANAAALVNNTKTS